MAEELHPGSALPVPHPNVEQYDAASDLLRALTAPVRLALIDLLADHAYCVHDVVDALDVPQPLVSQHLRVLRCPKLVTKSRRGREMVYQLVDTHVAHIVRDAVAHTQEREQ